MPTDTQAPQTQSAASNVGHFGDGRYSPLMQELFTDAKRVLGLSPEVADKLARRIGSDYGAIMSSGATTGIKHVTIGKVNKDGKVTVKEAATSVKGVALSRPLQVLKAICYINEAAKSFVNFDDMVVKLDADVQSWIETL